MTQTDAELRGQVIDFLSKQDVDFGYSTGNLNMDTTKESREKLITGVMQLIKARDTAIRVDELERSTLICNLCGKITIYSEAEDRNYHSQACGYCGGLLLIDMKMLGSRITELRRESDQAKEEL